MSSYIPTLVKEFINKFENLNQNQKSALKELIFDSTSEEQIDDLKALFLPYFSMDLGMECHRGRQTAVREFLDHLIAHNKLGLVVLCTAAATLDTTVFTSTDVVSFETCFSIAKFVSQIQQETSEHMNWNTASYNSIFQKFRDIRGQIEEIKRTVNLPIDYRNIFTAVEHYYKHRVIDAFDENGTVGIENLSVSDHYCMTQNVLKLVQKQKFYTHMILENNKNRHLKLEYFAFLGYSSLFGKTCPPELHTPKMTSSVVGHQVVSCILEKKPTAKPVLLTVYREVDTMVEPQQLESCNLLEKNEKHVWQYCTVVKHNGKERLRLRCC